ncbi:proteasome accessory factor PafA2 [Arcanobacterium buesumense]|uniref:Proteasome accessory factor PafA2 n=1 Tax=Arcanobacterium buesumense TaxID=2722751 RepID=A0A6H2ENN0_9ACTO|nr:proteasome accessory factor PafA2 [Arcanobacterium buesumense]
MTIQRIVGLETEFGITTAQSFSQDYCDLSATIVDAYARYSQQPVAAWDFHTEDPLNDARGFRIGPSYAHHDQLTNNPVPSMRQMARDTKITNAALINGGRWYVDHAHPEYSTPEVTNPLDAVIWDRAGEKIAQETMAILHEQGHDVVIYKNNVDGKGAAYGSHENYLVRRNVPFNDIIRYLTPFFVSRPILCGSGRVGLGQTSQGTGFQISQRADYVENVVGLETTFNRPIINTRDEPHADSAQYRRLHVIGGDANQFDYSILLKIGTTNLILWMLEQDSIPLELESLVLFEPVAASWEISHDPTLTRAVDMHDGTTRTACNIQEIYLDAVRATLERYGITDQATWDFMKLWQEILDTFKTDIFAAATKVEWIAKYRMLEGMRTRAGLGWDADKLRAFDLQWHDLRPSNSIVAKLDQAGHVSRLVTPSQVTWAAQHAPFDTRAFFRGELVRQFDHHIASIGWGGACFETDTGHQRLSFMDPYTPQRSDMGDFFDMPQTPETTIATFGS